MPAPGACQRISKTSFFIRPSRSEAYFAGVSTRFGLPAVRARPVRRGPRQSRNRLGLFGILRNSGAWTTARAARGMALRKHEPHSCRLRPTRGPMLRYRHGIVHWRPRQVPLFERHDSDDIGRAGGLGIGAEAGEEAAIQRNDALVSTPVAQKTSRVIACNVTRIYIKAPARIFSW